MSDEREAGIHWSVVVQEATKAVVDREGKTPTEIGHSIVSIASTIWDWHEKCFPPASVTTVNVRVPNGDPGPEPDEPYGQEERGFAKPAGQTCLCGAEMQYSAATATRSAAYFCNNKVKTRDKAEQDRQSALHPPVWIN